MMYLAVGLKNVAIVAGVVCLVMNDHPWFGFFLLMFLSSFAKPDDSAGK